MKPNLEFCTPCPVGGAFNHYTTPASYFSDLYIPPLFYLKHSYTPFLHHTCLLDQRKGILECPKLNIFHQRQPHKQTSFMKSLKHPQLYNFLCI